MDKEPEKERGEVVETEEWQITARFTPDAKQAALENIDELTGGQFTARKIEF